jgi:sugar phosphate isomerase/epimerase
MPDVLSFAEQHLGHKVEPQDFDNLVTVAQEIKKLCAQNNLKVLMLQPFSNFEGWKEGSEEREDAFRRARGWVGIMEAVGTDMLQVGSSDTPAEKIGMDRSRFVSDLQELADLLAEKHFRICYENWCWSTHAPDWKDVWDIVKKVDRSNIGLCLDTFQSAGGEWADPTTESGLLEDVSKSDLESRFQKSMDELSRTVPKDKIYLLQISDAYKVSPPISNKSDEDGLRPRGRWSHDYRPLPFNGGYLPVVVIAKAVLKTGFRGYFSYEVFDSGRNGKGLDYALDVYAVSARESHGKLLAACAES